jgi:hypothetical protein
VENDILISPFIEKEVFDSISNMEHNKAPGPEGFPAEFYNKFGHVIKDELMAAFVQLKDGDL